VRVRAGVLAVTEVRIEQNAAVAGEFADVRPTAPADEDMSVREELRVPLERREQLLRMVVAAEERRAFRRHVHPQREHARELLDRRRRAVVEHRDHSVRLASRIVLPGEPCTAPEEEVALLAPEPPEDLARPPA